eukprot:SAG31_NODE_630_length_13427_cov_27.066327_7_plen_79_part_00
MPRCLPAATWLEKLVVIQTHTVINRTKTTVCGIHPDYRWFPSRSTRAASSLPPDMFVMMPAVYAGVPAGVPVPAVPVP